MLINARVSLMAAVCGFTAVLFSCSDDEPASVDCSTLQVVTSSSENPTDCASPNGSITVQASGGQSPYTYSLNGGAFQAGASFAGLGAGEYSVTARDANNCEKSLEGISLSISGIALTFNATVSNSGCRTGEGVIDVVATGGSGDYSYKIDNGAFGDASVFESLTAGAKVLAVRDNDNGCTVTKAVNVLNGTSYADDIKSIIETSCAVSGCHVTGGAAPFALTTFSLIQSHAAAIKTTTGNGSMPKDGTPLTQQQKDLIACWVDDGAPNN